MARTMALIDQILPEIQRQPGAAERPAVTLSYAQSLDGSIAVRRGFPLQISGPECAQLTHQLRAAHDAILVGIGTVLADDPQLTVRHVLTTVKKIVKLLKKGNEGDTLKSIIEKYGIDTLQSPLQ